MDLNETGDDGTLMWTQRPEWIDGKIHTIGEGENTATYLYRTIDAAAGPVTVTLRRNGGIRTFLNGIGQALSAVTHSTDLGNIFGPATYQDKATLELGTGRNELLIKIINGGKLSSFHFEVHENKPPQEIRTILDVTGPQRSDEEKQQLFKWFAAWDPDWNDLYHAEQQHLGQQPKQDLLSIYAAREGGRTYEFGKDTRRVYFLTRGNSNQKQGLASPGYIQVLMTTEKQEKRWTLKHSSNADTEPRPPRIAFTDWITDTKHGAGHLLARVIVNRLWQQHFGRGIVGTPNDFGAQGDPPTHPELLDYLAARLILNGWNLKPIHRLIMTSAVYMQGGNSHAAGTRVDPNNRLWWRRPARRMEAEIIRDTLLAVSGTLDKKMFGPGSLEQDNPRRSVYLTVKRDRLIPILQLFDAPDAMQSIGRRPMTTVAPQALAMMNSAFVRDLAEKFARRVRHDERYNADQAVRQAYAIALSRAPSDEELQRMLQFIDRQTASYGNDPQATAIAVADCCQIVMCLNEFVFVD